MTQKEKTQKRKRQTKRSEANRLVNRNLMCNKEKKKPFFVFLHTNAASGRESRHWN